MDLILIWSLSNQPLWWIQSELCRMNLFQRKGKNNLEMIQGKEGRADAHRFGRLHNKVLTAQRQTTGWVWGNILNEKTHRKRFDWWYLCSFCHLLFKLRLGCGIFLHVRFVGLCSFFGFYSSLQSVNKQLNDEPGLLKANNDFPYFWNQSSTQHHPGLKFLWTQTLKHLIVPYYHNACVKVSPPTLSTSLWVAPSLRRRSCSTVLAL